MDWLDRIFGKKEEIEETKMSLKDVEDFLVNKLEEDLNPLRESVKKECLREYENLQTLANTLQDQLKSLEQVPYSGKDNPLLIRKAVGSRKSFVKKMKLLVKQIQKPIGEDIDSILDYHNEVAKSVNVTNAKTVGEYAFLKELFEEQGEKVVQSFRQIMETDKKLGNILKEFRNSSAKLLETQEIVAGVLKLTEELKKNETGELEKTTRKIEDKKKKIENELKNLFDSDELKTFLVMQKLSEDLRISLQNKKSDFMRSVTKMEKPLKKYRWSVENKILDDYVEGSFESVLLRDPKGEVFMSAIKDMKKKIIQGEIDLKDSDKFMTVIENMIGDNTIGKILEEYSKFSEELKNQEEKITLQEIPKRKNDLENEMNKLKREMEEIMVEKKRIEERRKIIQIDKEQKLRELEKILNDIAGKKILLEVN